jgi:Gamma-glutamyl cyclotransferase, AIG2-like
MQLLMLWPSILSFSFASAYQQPLAPKPSKVTTATDRDKATTFHYLAIGSNMLSDTMTSLRNLQPLSVTAAVLPGYELAFDIRGSPLEPSAASVRRRTKDWKDAVMDDDDGSCCCSLVHGVLYELTESDFAALGRSEGVPWTYRWERVHVIPYRGNGASAGNDAYRAWMIEHGQPQERAPPTAGSTTADAAVATAAAVAATTKIDSLSILALVLTASPLAQSLFGSSSPTNASSSSRSNSQTFIPPSPSYLQILRDGAAQWRLDQSYQDQLAAVPTDARYGWPGLSGWLLQAARWSNPQRPVRSL